MSNMKYIFYLKNGKNIVITDEIQNKNELQNLLNSISVFMSGISSAQFETSNDIVIIKPSEIAAVQIVKDGSSFINNTDEEDILSTYEQSETDSVNDNIIIEDDEEYIEHIVEDKVDVELDENLLNISDDNTSSIDIPDLVVEKYNKECNTNNDNEEDIDEDSLTDEIE